MPNMVNKDLKIDVNVPAVSVYRNIHNLLNANGYDGDTYLIYRIFYMARSTSYVGQQYIKTNTHLAQIYQKHFLDLFLNNEKRLNE